MVALGCLWFLFAACLLVPNVSIEAVKLSAEENLDFINKVLELLNGEQCVLPTFEEVDDLNLSFNELEEDWGADFESKLTEDQKLLKKTLLDQWESFQKRTQFGVVIRSAKKRSFLCKIESYQRAKFGRSVCTDTDVIPNPKPDVSYERNPIVRYLKHLEAHQVSEIEPPKIEIHLTPISCRVSVGSDFSPRGGLERGSGNGATEGENQIGDGERDQENYDPLADIPDVSVRSDDSDSEDSDTASSVDSNPFAPIMSSVSGNAFVPREESSDSANSIADVSTHVGPDGESGTGSVAVDVTGTKSPLVALNAGEVDGPSGAGGEDGAERANGAEYEEGSGDSDDTKDSSSGNSGSNSGSGPNATSKSEITAQGVEDSELVEDANDDIAATGASNANSNKRKRFMKSRDVVYVDDETDDKYLRRLTKIKPMLFEFGITYKGFKWPDESTTEEFKFDESVKMDWKRFVNNPDSCMDDITLFNMPENGKISGGGSFWAPGPKSEEKDSISEWDQTPVLSAKNSATSMGEVETKKLSKKGSSCIGGSCKLPKFICKSFGKLFSSKKRSRDKARLMKSQSDI